jgi:16S rRNA processing protein RimM
MADTRKILVGRIVAAQGLGGDVRVQTYTESPMDFKTLPAYGDALGKRAVHFVRLLNPGSSVIVARVDGATDRNAAEDLRGIELYVDRDAFPAPGAGEYYVADLIGLTVVKKAGGAVLGIVSDFQNFGGGDILELDNGEMVLFDGADVDLGKKIISVL